MIPIDSILTYVDFDRFILSLQAIVDAYKEEPGNLKYEFKVRFAVSFPQRGSFLTTENI